MLVRGATLALVSWAGCWLAGCADGGKPACATKVTPDVCATPANLRTDGIAQVMWGAEVQLELAPEPLVDGRYLLMARALSCAAEFVPPAEPLRVQGMVEIQGCVLRSTFSSAQGTAPQVSVATFNYGADGSLELKDACSAAPTEVMPTRYGFDGTTLQLPVSVELSGADGNSHSCSGIDSYGL